VVDVNFIFVWILSIFVGLNLTTAWFVSGLRFHFANLFVSAPEDKLTDDSEVTQFLMAKFGILGELISCHVCFSSYLTAVSGFFLYLTFLEFALLPLVGFTLLCFVSPQLIASKLIQY